MYVCVYCNVLGIITQSTGTLNRPGLLLDSLGVHLKTQFCKITCRVCFTAKVRNKKTMTMGHAKKIFFPFDVGVKYDPVLFEIGAH